MKKILSGGEVAKQILANVKSQIADLKTMRVCPNLKILLVGEDPGSEYYAKSILRKSKKVNIQAELIKLPTDIKQNLLIEKLHLLNNDPDTDAIQIMMPLPDHISTDKVTALIDPAKDVDCLNPLNMGKLVLGKDTFLPNTPAAVLKLLQFYHIKTDSKKIVILGRSNIVGKPLANLLIQKKQNANATVTICHSHTKQLAQITKSADILIVAIGKAKFITSKYVSSDSIIIDVGINRILDKDTKQHKYVGDVDFDDLVPKVDAITPVPGGIGSITTAVLLSNIVKAVQNK